MTGPAADDADVRRRNLILGSVLAALCLALMTTFIIIFSRYGFPKDPEVWRARPDADKPAQQVTP